MVKRVATHRTTAPLIEAPVRWWSDEPRCIARMLDLCAASAPGRRSGLHEALITLERSLPQLLEDGAPSVNHLEAGQLEADAVLFIAGVLARCGHEARAWQLLADAVEMGIISQQAAKAVGIAEPQGEPRVQGDAGSEARRKLTATHPQLLRDPEHELPLVFNDVTFVDGASLVDVMQALIGSDGPLPALGVFRRAVLANCIDWRCKPARKAIIAWLSSLSGSREAAPAVRALRAAMEISVDRVDRRALQACLRALGAAQDDSPRAKKMHDIKDAYCRLMDILWACQEPLLRALFVRLTYALKGVEELRNPAERPMTGGGLRLVKRYSFPERGERFLEPLQREKSYRRNLEHVLGEYVLHASLAEEAHLQGFLDHMNDLWSEAWNESARFF